VANGQRSGVRRQVKVKRRLQETQPTHTATAVDDRQADSDSTLEDLPTPKARTPLWAEIDQIFRDFDSLLNTITRSSK
jgi:hypothetical protein